MGEEPVQRQDGFLIPGREEQEGHKIEGKEMKLSSSQGDAGSRNGHNDQPQMEFVRQTDQGPMGAPLKFEIPPVETLREHEAMKRVRMKLRIAVG